jgi:basic membrane protein A
MHGRVKRKGVGLLAVLCVVVAACGDDDESSPSVPSAGTEASATPSTTAAEVTAATGEDAGGDESAGGSADSDLRIAMVSDGEVLLGGWYGSMEDGRLYLEDQTGLDVDLIENVAAGQVAQRTFDDLASDGYDVLISISTFDADVAAVAPDHPDTVFLQSCDATVLGNMAQYCAAVEQARYVDGVLAASLSEAGRIGYVIGFEIPFVLKPLNAFVRGAQTVNPDVAVDVVVTNSWFDPTLERQAAESLVNNGTDVLTYDLSSSAIPEVAAKNGIPFVGYGYDDAATQAPDAWAGGSLYNWGPIWVEQVESIRAGTWETTYAYGGFEVDFLDYSDLADSVPADVQALVETTLEQLRSGALDPLAGPVIDNTGEIAIPEGETADVATCCDWYAQGISGVGG